MDGTVVEQGQTPMTANLEHGKDYTVIISLAGYQTETIPVKSITDHNFDEAMFECLVLALCSLALIVAGEDPDDLDSSPTSNTEYKFEPSTINVQLKEVTTLDGKDTAIYAFLTIVYEDGRHQHATIEMTPVAAD